MTELICLTMIVKNEAKVIKRCLHAAEPFFDTFCIHDTGSNDDTMQLIKDEMKRQKKTGILAKATWSDYGRNRTQVFENANELVKSGTHVSSYLVLDADDVIIGNRKNLSTEGRDVAEIEIHSGGIQYRQRRLFNTKRDWRYVGKLHEYPTPTDNDIVTTNIIEEITIEHKSDGGSWKDEKKKYNEHVDIARSQDLSDPRNQFYLAQSLRAASRFHEAIKEYKKRVQMKTGWDQEAVYSMLMIARLKQTLGEHERAILDYMNCYEMDRTRKEALVELLCLLRRSGNFALGKLFGEELMKVRKLQDTGLFAEKTDWQTAVLELGLCHWYTGDKTKAKKLWTQGIRKEKTINTGTKGALIKNMKFD